MNSNKNVLFKYRNGCPFCENLRQFALICAKQKGHAENKIDMTLPGLNRSIVSS